MILVGSDVTERTVEGMHLTGIDYFYAVQIYGATSLRGRQSNLKAMAVVGVCFAHDTETDARAQQLQRSTNRQRRRT